MNEWCKNQKLSSNNIRQLLQERIEKAYLLHQLTAEETKRFSKLEAIAAKLNRGENVQSSG